MSSAILVATGFFGASLGKQRIVDKEIVLLSPDPVLAVTVE